MTVRELADAIAAAVASDPAITDAPVRLQTHCCEMTCQLARTVVRDSVENDRDPFGQRPTTPIFLIGEDLT